MEMNVENIR